MLLNANNQQWIFPLFDNKLVQTREKKKGLFLKAESSNNIMVSLSKFQSQQGQKKIPLVYAEELFSPEKKKSIPYSH